MSFTRKYFINRLYNYFHDEFKANGGNQQAAFDEVTEGQTRSVKTALKADLYVKGYTDIK
jgi:hypothetical protein